MTKIISYVSISVLLMVTMVASQVFADNSWVAASGNTYHWARTTETFSLRLINSMNGNWTSALEGAASDWSQSTVLDLVTESGSGKRSCRGVDGAVEACNASYGDNGWLGIASVWAYSDGHIVKGMVQMNDTYFNLPYYDTPEWRNLVVCQEIGHALGLDHQDEIFANANLNTCMDYTNSPASNQHPNDHDYLELESIYSHTDSFDSYAKASTGGGGGGKGKGRPQNVGQDIDPNNPASWGKVVRNDAHGNPSVYVRNLGNGKTVTTHVTWVEGYSEARD